ncbi:protein Iojap-related, mitochondrial-like [Pistacia vera]|uniref:protein Iojap-related, mitochondrial-like n=1 Tax=Pistacia vera TaxID=55513 RepID=UPI0012638D01|nr:protein Iojap-related, mitochondrial-like [Pistacia vera]
MWAALRYRSLNLPKSSASWNESFSFMSTFVRTNEGLLNLQDVEKVLTDVRADDVKVIPVGKQCDWTDFMVVATGRSTWHVKNIAQALIYKAKQKQKEIGARRLMLPSVQGQETGKWVVIDSGKVIVHALDEKARAYYNLENLWTMETSRAEPVQDLEKAFVKVRPKNNSKKPAQMQRSV